MFWNNQYLRPDEVLVKDRIEYAIQPASASVCFCYLRGICEDHPRPSEGGATVRNKASPGNAKSINADTAFLADFKFQPAGSLAADLLFKLRNAGHQFFFCGIVPRIAHDNAEDSEIQPDRPAGIRRRPGS
jgi:hypothetical protein